MRFLDRGEFAQWWQDFHADDADHTPLPDPQGSVVATTITAATGVRATIDAWSLPGDEFGQVPDRVGLICLRQGAYSLGLLEQGRLIKHHTGSWYVQGRTAAGGWSQQRYARRRRNQQLSQLGAMIGKLPQVITSPQALVWAGDRKLFEQLRTELINQPAPLRMWPDLPAREFADIAKPNFSVLKQVAWRSQRIGVREI